MQDILSGTAAINWGIIAEEMHEKGYAIIPRFLNQAQCEELKSTYDEPGIFRKTVVMERYRFGLGEYKYYDYPLPATIQKIRESLYPKLASIANYWMKSLKIDVQFPDSLKDLHALCRAHGQLKPTPLILKYGKGGYNTLHQDLYGDLYFPIQLVLLLNEPDEDFTGGEFILMEQTPRAQSKAVVLNPKRGDLLAFTTNFRPVKGSKGYYRANMKHGVSEVRDGERYTVGIIFHDALS
jgi:uncharacterized protein